MQSSTLLPQSAFGPLNFLYHPSLFPSNFNADLSVDPYSSFEALDQNLFLPSTFAPQVAPQFSIEELSSMEEFGIDTRELLENWMFSSGSTPDLSQLQDSTVQQYDVQPAIPPEAASAIPIDPQIAPTTKSHPPIQGTCDAQVRSSKSAIYLFEANVRLNDDLASGILSWGNMVKKAKEQGSLNANVNRTIDWGEAARSLGHSDFRAFYYRQREHARSQNAQLPVLPAWIVKVFFNGKSPDRKVLEPLSRVPKAASRVLVDRSPNRGVASTSHKAKGKARAVPYFNPHASSS